jgi:hypothetical protein
VYFSFQSFSTFTTTRPELNIRVHSFNSEFIRILPICESSHLHQRAVDTAVQHPALFQEFMAIRPPPFASVLRASLIEPVNPVGTEFFRRIYGFGPKVAQNGARIGGPARISNLGPKKLERRPV